MFADYDGCVADADAEYRHDIHCEHIPTWISLSGDLAFSHQDGIYGFKFPKRFSELSQAMTSPLFTLFT